MPRVLAGGRQDQRKAGEAFGVASGEHATAVVHGVEPVEQDAQGGGLELVEPEVVADLRVSVLVEAAVIAQSAAAQGDLRVAGEDGAPVAQGRKILGGIERQGSGAAKAAD